MNSNDSKIVLILDDFIRDTFDKKKKGIIQSLSSITPMFFNPTQGKPPTMDDEDTLELYLLMISERGASGRQKTSTKHSISCVTYPIS